MPKCDTGRMAAELTITIWTEGPADAGTSKALADAACQTILNQSAGAHRAAVVNAQAFELPLDALRMVLPLEEAAAPTPLASPVPPADPLAAPELPVEAISPFELPAPPAPVVDPAQPVPTEFVAPTEADVAAAPGQPVVQVAPATVEIAPPTVTDFAAVLKASSAKDADTKPAETATAEATPLAVDAAVSATSDPAAVPYPTRSEQETELRKQLADLEAQDAAAVDANGSAS